MDEYDRGMEPETKAYLKKVIKSFFVGAIWLLVLMTFGLFMGFGIVHDGWQWYNYAFYIFFVVSFVWMVRYYHRKWKIDFDRD
jgi:membrane protein DedA with SNARE-associated domain